MLTPLTNGIKTKLKAFGLNNSWLDKSLHNLAAWGREELEGWKPHLSKKKKKSLQISP